MEDVWTKCQPRSTGLASSHVADPRSSSPDPAPTRLVLVRHGESQVTVRRVVGGLRTCSGLSERGIRQAERLAARLLETRELEVDALYASSYPRAMETAEHLAPVLGAELQVEPGFGEHDPGPDCDGMSFDDFVERFGMPNWEADPYGVTFPGGETLADFHHRVGTALRAILDRNVGSTVMVVCHGGVIDFVMRFALRAPPTGVFDLHTTNASLTELLRVRPDRWRLVRYNDTAHLAGLEP